ncbi:PAF1-like protein [Mya arenaria]|uniref:RNA polymerase II-associated factor 1 homolog n=1 Tax=Mya arenaria TaxID=6604 RepID=A0ABY7FH00_MYAAR|nr:PAF1-like protein [Mya arenaria]
MNVSWLRKTEYFLTEYNRFTQKADKSETNLDDDIEFKRLFEKRARRSARLQAVGYPYPLFPGEPILSQIAEVEAGLELGTFSSQKKESEFSSFNTWVKVFETEKPEIAMGNRMDEKQNHITQHYSKPKVEPIEVLPVFPDFELWKHPFAQVIFDSDPAP